MVLRSSAWSLPWEKVILMMLLTPFGVDLWNTLLYHLEALQLSFSPFFLCSFPTLSEGYNTLAWGLWTRICISYILVVIYNRKSETLCNPVRLAGALTVLCVGCLRFVRTLFENM